MCGRNLKGSDNTKRSFFNHQRIALTKGVVETRDHHDSPEVDAIRQKLLEYYAGSVIKDQTGGNPPIRGPHGEAEIIFKASAIPVKQRMFQIQGVRRAAWVKSFGTTKSNTESVSGVAPPFLYPTKNRNDY
jgi:hypothetical protein